MAISLSICNLALGDIRASAILDIGEPSIEAQMCTRYYPHCLSLILDDYTWQFTKTIAALSQLSTNIRSTEWGYAYQLPNDCDQAIRLMPTGTASIDYACWGWDYAQPDARWWTKFIVEAGVLYCNVINASLEYASTISDETKMPALFREALRKLLAANLAVPLRDDSNLEIKLLKEASAARDKAIASDMNRAPVYEPFDEVAWARR